MDIRVVGHNCTTAAGRGFTNLWNALTSGQDFGKQGHCGWFERWEFERVSSAFAHHWVELLRDKQATLKESRLGVIVASTKGAIEDIVWGEKPDLSHDPISPLMDKVIEKLDLNPIRSQCVSNACCSTHSAVRLAEQWITWDIASSVLILAGDFAGEFVRKGFSSLGAVTQKGRCAPFSGERDGLQLGTAFGYLHLKRSDSGLRLLGTGVDAEGSGPTRTSPDGRSLATAIREATKEKRPDVIVAHGTATLPNDAAEDSVFSEVYGRQTPWVTATKWSVGHCLGASGVVDLVAACEILKRQQLFPIANTQIPDENFSARYALLENQGEWEETSVRTVLSSSLGFGGIHAAVSLGAEGGEYAS